MIAPALTCLTQGRKKTKNSFLPLLDKILLRKRPIIETFHDQFKNIGQIKSSRHRRLFTFRINLASGLMGGTVHPDKPSLGIPDDELYALPHTTF